MFSIVPGSPKISSENCTSPFEKHIVLQKLPSSGFKSISLDLHETSEIVLTFSDDDTTPLLQDGSVSPTEEKNNADDSKSPENNNNKDASATDITMCEFIVAGAEDDEECRTVRLDQIKELLKKKPGFAAKTKPQFPVVRRAQSISSTSPNGGLSKTLPKFLSLKLFNPETDDLDSDSSGESSPESDGSVISVISTSSKHQEKEKEGEDKFAEDLLTVKIEVEKEKTKTKRPDSMKISPVEATWNEECSQHLKELTERLNGSLCKDIDQFCKKANADNLDDIIADSKFRR